jgi:aspartyl-tRNA(Asn)/glutamyl-tRNA(Gln) amidotransferase subunit A
MTSDPALLSAIELLERYRDGSLSPVEATQAALARIDRHNPTFNAFNLVDPESALAAARESEVRWRQGAPRGRLDGVPTAIKDIVLTTGWPTLRGSKAVDPDQAWNEDAPAVARLREHGAVLLGKTTTPEFGWKGVTDSPLTGITRNPWNPALTPGGSSGGSAVALATGMAALAIGTDGGGSIRIPAGFPPTP